jgi:glucose-1-phosphate cytidylyltransferase
VIPTIILCGGRGTRISEGYPTIPKPLVPIGGRPILWHIMKIYSSFGHTDFVLALGWLGEEIRRYFLEYWANNCDFTVDLSTPDSISYATEHPEKDWRVTCCQTGVDSLTGTRVRRAAARLGGDRFMVTYGDGLGNVDLTALLAHHESQGRLATMTAVQPPSRFGELIIDDSGVITEFAEKPQTSTGAINGGFMIFEVDALDRYFPAEGDYMLEREPLARLAADGQLNAFVHNGFWQPMDTPRERELLEGLWNSGDAPWRTWS